MCLLTIVSCLDAKTSLEETNKAIFQNEEELSVIEKDRLKIMSELALEMQKKVRIPSILALIFKFYET